MRTVSLFVVVALLFGCARQPDAEAVRDTIRTMAAAVAERSAGDVLDHIGDDFTGNDGAFDRARVAELVRAQLLVRSVSVQLGPIEVDLFGERATATFDAALSDTSGRWIAAGRTDLHFVTAWRREGGEWRCYNAQWTQD